MNGTSARVSIHGLTTLAVALLLAGAWLWICYCRFPASTWNDLRLVPVFMAAQGEPVYTLPGSGVLTTWMYGPVPLWAWSPALCAQNAVSALLTAGAVNLAISVFALGFACFFWPFPGATRQDRFFAFGLCILVWPDHAFRFLQADNLAIALTLVGNVWLVRSPRSTLSGWIAASCMAGALGCKQTTLGLFVAQLIWLGREEGKKKLIVYAAKTTLAGALIAGIAVRQFGAEELCFTLVSVGSALPAVENIAERFLAVAPILAVQWGAPLVAFMLPGWAPWKRGHALGLPFWAWVCSLPLGCAGLLSTGGSTNHLHGFQLLVPVLLLALLVKVRDAGRQRLIGPGTVALMLVLIIARITNTDHLPLAPATQSVETARLLHRKFPGQLWLPWNPLVSYFEDEKFYHAEDGIYVRFITGHPVSLKQARAHLPPRFHVIALPSPAGDWGFAEKLAPPDALGQTLPGWKILRWSPPPESTPQ